MKEEDEKDKPFLDDDSKLIEKKDEEMRDTYEKYCKLLNKMKKNVENMGSNKLMNYQNLFNDFNNDIIKFNEEGKKLLKLKDDLNEETNLPDKIKKNLDRVNKDFENNKKIIEKLKLKVEEYKDKYTKEETKKYDEMFNKEANPEDNEDIKEKKIILKNNEEIFEERKNMIIEAKKTSGQVVDTAKMINNVVHQQGQSINDIENNIIEAVDNFKKGGEKIKKFKETTEKKINIKKLLILCGGIFVLILIIYFMLRKLF